MEHYDPGNIFARILRGEVPATKVFENKDVLAFMDVMPQADGHVLVVPKSPSRGLLDADPSTLGLLIHHVQTIAGAVKQAMKADGIVIQQFNEAAGGQTVFHLHVHIIPRWHGVALKPHTGEMADRGLLAAQAEKIAAALSL